MTPEALHHIAGERDALEAASRELHLALAAHGLGTREARIAAARHVAECLRRLADDRLAALHLASGGKP